MWFNLFLLIFSLAKAEDDSELSLQDSILLEFLQFSPIQLQEEDIIVDVETPGEESSVSWSKQWPSGVVPYLISPSFTKEERQKILSAMEEIQRETCVRFHKKTRGDHDFVIVTKAHSGCYSTIGRKGGPQQLNLDGNCVSSRKVILHEFMHALGFIHEQNREDRDEYVKIVESNIPTDKLHNFEKYKKGQTIFLTPEYAYDSIMHYHWNAFAINKKKPTIVPKRSGIKLEEMGGPAERLSPVDIKRINRHYECPGSKKTSPTHPPPSPSDGFGWKSQDDGVTWSSPCDFPGNDLKGVRVPGDQCWGKCKETSGCDHFTWINGICLMKKGFNQKFRARRLEGAVCGYRTSARNGASFSSSGKISWNRQSDGVTWAMGCDFFGDDIYAKQMEGKNCGPACKYDRKCTHFTWTDYNGGTCWMKRARKGKAMAVSGISVCGYLSSK